MGDSTTTGTGWLDLLRGGRAPLIAALTLGIWLHAADSLLIVTTLPSATAKISASMKPNKAVINFCPCTMKIRRMVVIILPITRNAKIPTATRSMSTSIGFVCPSFCLESQKALSYILALAAIKTPTPCHRPGVRRLGLVEADLPGCGHR